MNPFVNMLGCVPVRDVTKPAFSLKADITPLGIQFRLFGTYFEDQSEVQAWLVSRELANEHAGYVGYDRVVDLTFTRVCLNPAR